jgi:hypothetical protein
MDSWFPAFRQSIAGFLEDNCRRARSAWYSRSEWTEIVDSACRHADAATDLGKLTSKGLADDERRCEYLAIDAIVHDGWRVPRLMVEYENRPERAEYSAWKLLCTRAERRLLIGYFFAKSAFGLDDVLNRIKGVSALHQGETLYVLLAPFDGPAKAGKWLEHYQAYVIVNGEIQPCASCISSP